MPLLSLYKVTAGLFEINQLDWCTTFFKSSAETSQDTVIVKAIEHGKFNLMNHLIKLLPLNNDPKRVGKFARTALLSGHYLVAHELLHLQTYAITYALPPSTQPQVPLPRDVYKQTDAQALKETAQLWEVRAEGNAHQLSLLNTLPDELIALIALYLQVPHRKDITPEQRQSLLYFGYKPAVTLSWPDKASLTRPLWGRTT